MVWSMAVGRLSSWSQNLTKLRVGVPTVDKIREKR